MEWQRTCFGAVKLHPINNANGIADWDYPVCGSVLLAHPGHPHREDYETSDIHSVIPYGISNTNVSEYEFTYFNNHEVAASNVWRGGGRCRLCWNPIGSCLFRPTTSMGV